MLKVVLSRNMPNISACFLMPLISKCASAVGVSPVVSHGGAHAIVITLVCLRLPIHAPCLHLKACLHFMFAQVFGSDPWLWFLPVWGAGPAGDGIHWPTHRYKDNLLQTSAAEVEEGHLLPENSASDSSADQ